MSATTTEHSTGKGGPARPFLSRPVGMFAVNAAAVLAGILLWGAVTSQGVVGLPGPMTVASQAIVQAENGQLLSDALASVGRVLTGFALGVIVAVPVGFLMGWYRIAR